MTVKHTVTTTLQQNKNYKWRVQYKGHKYNWTEWSNYTYFTTGIPVIPKGLIVFYDGTTAPDGWESYTEADNKFIVCASPGIPSYNLKDIGAAIAPNYISSVNGGHTGSSFQTAPTPGGSVGGNPGYVNGGTSGSHSHDVDFLKLEPPFNSLKLIKSKSTLYSVKPNIVFLNSTSNNFSHIFSNILTNSKLLKIQSSPQSGGGTLISEFSGNHDHKQYSSGYEIPSFSGSYGYEWVNLIIGGHTHPVSQNFIFNIYRKTLTAWKIMTEYTGGIDSGMIGLWESPTPPIGWAICNGDFGTPDLRRCFIELNNYLNINLTALGNNTFSSSNCSLLSVNAGHTHQGGDSSSSPGYEYSCAHTYQDWIHSHTIQSFANVNYKPLHFSLNFIQKIN